MKYEVQVHYENQGTLSFVDEFEDFDELMGYYSGPSEDSPPQLFQCQCKDTGRHIYVNMKTVTAIIATPKVNTPNLFERAYAVKEIQE